MENLLTTLEEWFNQGFQVALATVVKTWGSSPRPIGSSMAITRDGKISGSVSGGCIESAVVENAIKVLDKEKPIRLHFGVTDSEAWEVGLSCGGEIEVFVREIDMIYLEIWKQALSSNLEFCSVLMIDGSEKWLGKELIVLEDGKIFGEPFPNGEQGFILDDTQTIFKNGNSTCKIVGETFGEFFFHLVKPKPTLIIVGGVHIAIPLVRYAEISGFDVIVIDPRKLFGTQERFPGVKKLLNDWPQQAFNKIQVNSSTAIVMLTHDPKIDDPALKAALTSPAFYIGALGSKKTHQKRLARLIEDGVDPDALIRIHAPVGIDLGGRLPQEIALSIMSEIVKEWNALS